MERKDVKRYVGRNVDPGIKHMKSTELSGTPREADLIVRGLKALRGMVEMRDAAGISPAHSHFSGGEILPSVPQLEEINQLLEEIGQPNPVDPQLGGYVAPRTLADLD